MCAGKEKVRSIPMFHGAMLTSSSQSSMWEIFNYLILNLQLHGVVQVMEVKCRTSAALIAPRTSWSVRIRMFLRFVYCMLL